MTYILIIVPYTRARCKDPFTAIIRKFMQRSQMKMMRDHAEYDILRSGELPTASSAQEPQKAQKAQRAQKEQEVASGRD